VNGRARTLVLGGLDPLHTVTGIQARLNNLGFHTGAVDGVIGPITRRAIRKFQASRSLIVDGIVGPKTREALARAHGEVT
jgi:peptidoglycan hydrolase-like protein with peptidoglycan-binding domain